MTAENLTVADNPDVPSKREFISRAIKELWEAREEPSELTDDIDLVWAVSSTGTVEEPAYIKNPETGELIDSPYNGVLFDKEIVDNAISTVVEVTALRLGKDVSEVTREDVAAHGPTLLYNGETPGLPNSKFPNQIKHFKKYLKKLSKDPKFPIPRHKVVAGKIDDANTVAQVRQLSGYLHGQSEKSHPVRRMAVVSGLGHSIRVGRYLQQHMDSLPEDLDITPVFVMQDDEEGHQRESKIVALELKKALVYRKLGHLAETSALVSGEVVERRPNIMQEKRLKGIDSVRGVIFNEANPEQFYLVTEKDDPLNWKLPGGKFDNVNEKPDEAMGRESKQEITAGMEVLKIRRSKNVRNDDKISLRYLYWGEGNDSVVKPTDEIASAGWFTEETIPPTPNTHHILHAVRIARQARAAFQAEQAA